MTDALGGLGKIELSLRIIQVASVVGIVVTIIMLVTT